MLSYDVWRTPPLLNQKLNYYPSDHAVLHSKEQYCHKCLESLGHCASLELGILQHECIPSWQQSEVERASFHEYKHDKQALHISIILDYKYMTKLSSIVKICFATNGHSAMHVVRP